MMGYEFDEVRECLQTVLRAARKRYMETGEGTPEERDAIAFMAKISEADEILMKMEPAR